MKHMKQIEVFPNTFSGEQNTVRKQNNPSFLENNTSCFCLLKNKLLKKHGNILFEKPRY